MIDFNLTLVLSFSFEQNVYFRWTYGLNRVQCQLKPVSSELADRLAKYPLNTISDFW